MNDKQYTHTELLNNLTLALSLFLAHNLGYSELKKVYNWTNEQMLKENVK